MARVTVEDCLEQIPNRFSMALLAAKRARQLLRGSDPMVKDSSKPCVTALREVAAGRVSWDTSAGDLIRGDAPAKVEDL